LFLWAKLSYHFNKQIDKPPLLPPSKVLEKSTVLSHPGGLNRLICIHQPVISGNIFFSSICCFYSFMSRCLKLGQEITRQRNGGLLYILLSIFVYQVSNKNSCINHWKTRFHRQGLIRHCIYTQIVTLR
jgi:hypothetical protein